MLFVIVRSDSGDEMSDVDGLFRGTPKQPAKVKSFMVTCFVVDVSAEELRVVEAAVDSETSVVELLVRAVLLLLPLPLLAALEDVLERRIVEPLDSELYKVSMKVSVSGESPTLMTDIVVVVVSIAGDVEAESSEVAVSIGLTEAQLSGKSPESVPTASSPSEVKQYLLTP